MAIFAEMTENECINERHPLVKGDKLTILHNKLKSSLDRMHF